MTDEIREWLSALDLVHLATKFEENQVDLRDLPLLSENDLRELDIPLGPRRRLLEAIADGVSRSDNTRAQVAGKMADTIAPDAERRHLTVMFVDLVGSTEMASKTDPEDMRTVITNYQNTVAGIVSRFEGFVAKFMGDGVMCYFGWPQANEDDAERAVRAGLAMIDAVRQTSSPDGTPLSTHVGIATGVVVVGDLIGSGATQEAAVVGETPNLAARLQGLAEPNQLVLPKETQSLLGNIFELEPMGAHSFKGIAKPVDAFLVIGENTTESRFAARQRGTLTPIVGRERELGLIRERWTKAKSGTGQMIVVSGEAGIGKSRIARAAIDEFSQDDYIRMTYQCSPYHADSAFYPVIQQMSFAAGFLPSDDPDARLDKLEALLGEDHAILKLVAPMVGLDGTERYGALDLTPAQQRAQTMKASTRLLVQQAEQKPLLLVYEDLHWIDPTSLELLEISLDAITDQQIMILATARPKFEYSFGGHPIVTRFALNRLGKDQIAAIASKLTGGKALPDEIMEIIAHRTDGIPLFVEELTKTILESGALKEDGERFVLDGPLSVIAIPTTLHDSLMARLDRLQPIKEVAQTAACIGREFRHGLLAKVSQLPEAELGAALNGLIEAELIYRRGLPPEATYLFKHSLVRDAAYESLLKEKRRAVHNRILTALETDTDIAPEVLAVHAEAANLTDRAIDLWEIAGNAAIARPAFDEGMAHLSRAIELLVPRVSGDDRAALERSLAMQTKLGYAAMARHGWGHDKTKLELESALVLADEIGETPLRFAILYGLMTTRYLRGDHVEAVKHGQVFVDLTEQASETAPAVVANRSYAISLMLTGQFDRAQPMFDRALELLDPEKHQNLAHRYGMDLGMATHGFVCFNLVFRGETRRAAKLFRECEHYAEICEDVTSNCYCHMVGAIVHMLTGNEAELARHTESLSLLAQEYNLSFFRNYAEMNLALLQAGRGDESGLTLFLKSDVETVATKTLCFIPMLRTEAARRALALGRRDLAHQFATRALEITEQTGEANYLSDLHRLQGSLASEDGDVVAAEQELTKAIVIARSQGGKILELRAATDLARILQEQERTDEAIVILNPVHDSIAEGDCPDDCAAARELLAALKG